MQSPVNYYSIPRSRIATFDIFSIARKKHQVSALLEIDVTNGRSLIKARRKTGQHISFLAWIIKVISKTIEEHPETAAFVLNN